MNDIKVKISVIMPTYNDADFLREAIESIRNQTYQNWELLVINEYGSDLSTTKILQEYESRDKQIKFIQNREKLGLAESLNKGIHIAQGEYIARMDADDISHPTRFEKQVKLLRENPDIGLCGTYQHHFGQHMNWIHMPAVLPEECKANLLFDCDLCHSTVMFRKKVFLDHNLLYDKNYLAEDFELWSRAVRVVKFTNIPEVLGEYRWDGNNISLQKKDILAKENAVIVANALKRNLGIIVPKEDYILLEGWGNPFIAEKDKYLRKKMYERFQYLLIDIYKRNQQRKFYEEQALLNTIASQWRYVRYMEPRNSRRTVNSLNEIFNPHYIPDYKMMWKVYRERSTSFKDDIRKIWNYLKWRVNSLL